MELSKIFYLLMGLILSFTLSLNATTLPTYKQMGLEIRYAQGPSFHKGAPLNLSLCIEGCPSWKQEARTGGQFSVALFKSFHKNHQSSLGLGYSWYQYKDYFNVWNLSTFEIEYREGIKIFHFFQISLDHKFFFSRERLLNPFTAVRINCEIPNDTPLRTGLGGQISAGFQTKFFHNFGISVAAYYKRFLTDYTERSDYHTLDKYRPYNYGLEFGLLYKF